MRCEEGFERGMQGMIDIPDSIAEAVRPMVKAVRMMKDEDSMVVGWLTVR